MFGAILGSRAGSLFVCVGAGALLGARAPRGGRRHLDRVGADAASSRPLGQTLELIGGLVDRL